MWCIYHCYSSIQVILWGASHNMQRVSKHGFEQYLAKYISKAEPSCKIELPESATLPQRYLCMCIVVAIEAVEVLMGFHQTRQVSFLHTELCSNQHMLKHNSDLYSLLKHSQDIYRRAHTFSNLFVHITRICWHYLQPLVENYCF